MLSPTDLLCVKTGNYGCDEHDECKQYQEDYMAYNIAEFKEQNKLFEIKTKKLKDRIKYVRRSNKNARIRLSKGGVEKRILPFPKYEDYFPGSIDSQEVIEPDWYCDAFNKYQNLIKKNL